jgi:hypothetical protein
MRLLLIPALLLRRVAWVLYSGGDLVNGLAERWLTPAAGEAPATPALSAPSTEGPPAHWLERVQHVPPGHWIALRPRDVQGSLKSAWPSPGHGPDAAPDGGSRRSSHQSHDRPAARARKPDATRTGEAAGQKRTVAPAPPAARDDSQERGRSSSAGSSSQPPPEQGAAPVPQAEENTRLESRRRHTSPAGNTSPGSPKRRDTPPPDLAPSRPARLRPPSRRVAQHASPPSPPARSRLAAVDETARPGTEILPGIAPPESPAERSVVQPQAVEGAPARSRAVDARRRGEVPWPAPSARKEDNIEFVPEDALEQNHVEWNAAAHPWNTANYPHLPLPTLEPAIWHSSTEPSRPWGSANQSESRDDILSPWPPLPEPDERAAGERYLVLQWMRFRQEWQRQVRLDREQQGIPWNESLF